MNLKPNTAAPGVPFYTPYQDPPSGTAQPTKDEADKPVPTVFTPLRIRSITLPNRFVVSPMCMYSADEGHLTDFHLVHLGQFALRGAGLTIIEATAVTPNGRISPQDSGIWADSHIAALKRVTDYVHSQGHLIGIQIGHAGRKASTRAPWLVAVPGHNEVAKSGDVEKGWEDDVVAPSALKWAEGYAMPKEITREEIKDVVEAFRLGAERAVKAGVDMIEIHAAHGYLLTQFLSPVTNKRTDEYGGSFENRTRLLFEVVAAVRSAIPQSMPLWMRISATEWMEWTGEPSWDLDQTIQLARLLPAAGIDVLDVSSGGNNENQRVDMHRYYQVSLADAVRRQMHAEGVPLLIATVGLITDAKMAAGVVQPGGEDAIDAVNAAAVGPNSRDSKPKGEDTNVSAINGTVAIDDEHGRPAHADLVLMGRQFLREPEFVLRAAHQLGVNVKWPNQYHRAPWPKDQKI